MLSRVFLLFILLSSCSSKVKYKEKLSDEIGKTEDEIVMKYGNPNSVYESKNAKYLYWKNLDKNFLYDSCLVWFKIEKGVVTEYNFTGIDCGGKL